MDEPSQSPRAFRHLDTITALFVAVLLISNIASSAKMVRLVGPFAFDAGTLLFPLSYIFGDILTEVYGYRRSRKVIWLGFGCNALMALVLWIVRIWPAAPFETRQEAYVQVLGLTGRIVLASFVAYFAGEFSNSFTLAKMKILTRGRWLWTRTIGSTLVGEGVDTALFVGIAFLGALNWTPGQVWMVGITNYLFKVGVEAVLTPATYAVVGFLKRTEGVDTYDTDTNFNPFVLRESPGT
jgi:uncharacterized integral membrane protein (TIGR00697 family)